MTTIHPFTEAARNLARRTNRRAIRWAGAGTLVVVGIVGILAYSVQSSWVSETTANADTVANYQNQTLQNDVTALRTPTAATLFSQTEANYGAEWNALTTHISDQQAKTAHADQVAADRVASTLLFPNLRADYQAWASERAGSQPAVTAKQEAQLQVLAVAETACQDYYAGNTRKTTMAAFRRMFAPEQATGLEIDAIELGLQQCAA